VAKEFAREFPKIAGRLAIEDFPCPDPYVERLLEGFAFLTARVQLKLDAEFPRFTQNLLETVCPHYLAPTPSMCVVQMQHETGEAGLAEGHVVRRGSAMRSVAGRGQTSCEYRTSQDLTLWPAQVLEARYYTRDAGLLELHKVWGGGDDAQGLTNVRAAVRIRLKTTAGLNWKQVAMRSLRLFLKGSDATPFRLYEQMLAHVRAVVVRPPPNGNKPGTWQETFGTDERGSGQSHVRRVGYRADEALLPYDARSFQGYRLLHEYFAFPERFLFVDVGDISRGLARCDGQVVDVIIALTQENVELEGAVSADNFVLNAVPAVNLFPKRADRIMVTDRASEFQVIPDRTRPLDFEVFRVTGVTGYGSKSGDERRFSPFYTARDTEGREGYEQAAYYATNRVPRTSSDREQRQGPRSRYAGSEVYVSLVDARNSPYSPELRQLGVEALCTNRDLPLQMAVGKGMTDFTLDVGAPVSAVRVVAGPTAPRPSHAEGDASWRLISHLSLNYLSIVDEDLNGDGRIDDDERHGAAALKDLLRLYIPQANDQADAATLRKQAEGLKGVDARAIVRRVPSAGAVAFARGLEVSVTFDESQFEGTGVFLLGSVLEQFFARYVSLNSFTETVVRSLERGEIMRWSARVGQRPIH
jgi:type VI secretion system protein ImpG